jgi:hypothetical protein
MMPNIFNGYFTRNSSLYTRITRSYHKHRMYSVRSTYGLRCSRFKAIVSCGIICLLNSLTLALTVFSKESRSITCCKIWNVDTVMNVTLSSCRMSLDFLFFTFCCHYRHKATSFVGLWPVLVACR